MAYKSDQIRAMAKEHGVVIDEDTMMYVGPNDPCWKKIPATWLLCECCGTENVSDNPDLQAEMLCDRCADQINNDEIIGYRKGE